MNFIFFETRYYYRAGKLLTPDPPASTPQVLGLEACYIMPNFFINVWNSNQGKAKNTFDV